MKTLFERLKPEYAERLENEREQYESACLGIERELSKNIFVSHLPIQTIWTMQTFVGGKGLSDPWSYFEEVDNE